MRCPNCGHENREEDRFCTACGKSLGELPREGGEPAAVPVPPQPAKFWQGIRAVLAVLLFIGVMVACQSCVTSGYVASFMMQSGMVNAAAANGMFFETEDMMTQLLEAVNENTVMILLVSSLLTILVLCLFFRLRRRRPAEEFALYFVNPLRLAEFALLGTALNVVISVGIGALPLPENLFDELETQYIAMYGGNLFLELFTVAFVGPVCEEILFRGIAMTRLEPVLGGPAAVILSALLFGLVHGTPLAIGYSFVMGLLLAAVFLRYRSILPGIVLHCFFNLTSYWLVKVGEEAQIAVFAVSAAFLVLLTLSTLLLYPRFDDVLCDVSGRIRLKDPEKQAIVDECRRLRGAERVSPDEIDRLRERWDEASRKKSRKS